MERKLDIEERRQELRFTPEEAHRAKPSSCSYLSLSSFLFRLIVHLLSRRCSSFLFSKMTTFRILCTCKIPTFTCNQFAAGSYMWAGH